MKLIIDIDENIFTRLYDNGVEGVSVEDELEIEKVIRNGTPMPDKCGKIYAEKDIREQIENPYQCQTVLYGLELVKPIIIEGKANETDN